MASFRSAPLSGEKVLESLLERGFEFTGRASHLLAMYAALKDKLPPDVWDYPTPRIPGS
jgi:hypothetical protein